MAGKKRGDHVVVMTPGPGGHFQSPAGTEPDEQIALILGGALMEDMADKDGNPPEAVKLTMVPSKPPKDDEAAEAEEPAATT